MIPFLDLQRQYLEIKNEIDAAVARAMGSGWYILGRECEAFEHSFKEYLFDREEGYAIGVNSGTDALKLSLLAAGIRPGDEVITVANTAIPTVTAICSVGAIPIFCGVDPFTWLMDPKRMESCVTGKTKAVLPVHLYGAACEMGEILSFAREYRLAVIEDVAQALGAEYNGKKCGTIGDLGAFSFYPSKNLGACGDGGAIFTRSSEKRDLLVKLRNYGQSSRYKAEVPNGENSRLDEVQAAILSVKLQHLDRWNGKRRDIAAYYRAGLERSGRSIILQKEHERAKSAIHLLVIKVNASLRDELSKKMMEKGVQTLIHYPVPIYRQPAFQSYKRHPDPIAEDLCSSILSLPFHQYLETDEIDHVVDSLKQSMA
jgi:dTDP-4-amino-4,6-dideoxygalactose transaminase